MPLLFRNRRSKAADSTGNWGTEKINGGTFFDASVENIGDFCAELSVLRRLEANLRQPEAVCANLSLVCANLSSVDAELHRWGITLPCFPTPEGKHLFQSGRGYPKGKALAYSVVKERVVEPPRQPRHKECRTIKGL